MIKCLETDLLHRCIFSGWVLPCSVYKDKVLFKEEAPQLIHLGNSLHSYPQHWSFTLWRLPCEQLRQMKYFLRSALQSGTYRTTWVLMPMSVMMPNIDLVFPCTSFYLWAFKFLFYEQTAWLLTVVFSLLSHS